MDQAPTHEPGEVFGPYTLERPLGRGAAAEVWQVVEEGDLGFSKRQALKLLKPPPGEMETQKKALINEARVCGRLKHPGVVDVYKVGAHDGELYIAMEFVDGPDLNTLLVALRKRKHEIPVKAAIEAAVDLTEALDYAHNAADDNGDRLGIVHRDLKPSNVLVDRRGILKISDWGLVKSTLNIESTTRGIVKGTPGYIAPEVWGGTRDFKPAADLFAVGAMLYEFLAGERLFQGRNLARIAEQVARRKPEEEAAKVADRCPELVPTLTRLLQRAPARRYATGADLLLELRPLAEAAEGATLKSFLRSVRPVLDEIAPVRVTTRFPRGSTTASGSGPIPVAPASPEPDEVPTPGEEADMTATDEAPALQPHQLGPQADTMTAPPMASEPGVAAPEPPPGFDPEETPAPPSFITGAGRTDAASQDVPETRAMAPSARMPAEIGPADETPAPRSRATASLGPDGKPRRRRRRRRPPPPPKKVPSSGLAIAVAVLGVLLLGAGIAAVFYVGLPELPF